MAGLLQRAGGAEVCEVAGAVWDVTGIVIRGILGKKLPAVA